MNDPNIMQPLNLNAPVPSEKRQFFVRSDSEFEPLTPLTPNRAAQKAAKKYQIDQEALRKYKLMLQKRVAWAFVVIFFVIIERIFAGYFRDDENRLIASLQKSLGIKYQVTNLVLVPVMFLENYLIFLLLLTHYFVIVYYYYNAVTCLKIMYVFFTTVFLVTILETIFGDPRPYWDSEDIVGGACTNSYGFPSFTLFCILFLFMYSWYCFSEDDDEDEGWTKMDILKCVVFVVLFGGFSFLKILAGLDYISQIVLTVLYACLFYYLAVFFDKSITNIVEKSSIDVRMAKRFTIFWLTYILIFIGVATIIYETSETFIKIKWFSNYFTCVQKHQNADLLKDTPYYHVLGPWGSFLRSVVICLHLGAVFGAAKAFRDFDGGLWFYSIRPETKARMTAIACFCILPSWLIVLFQSPFVKWLERGGIDEYLFNGIHFGVLYYLLFGFLPKHVFVKLRMMKLEGNQSFAGNNELVRLEQGI